MKNRKFTVALAFLTLLSVFYIGCPPNRPTHVGKWIDSSLRDAIVFHNDGTFESLYFYHYDPALQLGQPPPPIPPDDNTWKVRFRGTYVIDFSKDPAWIDLVFTDQGTPRRSQGLITFPNNNIFYAAFDNVRPASIDNSSRRARFTRAAPNEIEPVSK